MNQMCPCGQVLSCSGPNVFILQTLITFLPPSSSVSYLCNVYLIFFLTGILFQLIYF